MRNMNINRPIVPRIMAQILTKTLYTEDALPAWLCTGKLWLRCEVWEIALPFDNA
jgi:hypothetical protein